MNMTLEQLRAALREPITSAIRKHQVSDMHLSEDTDHDGEPILRLDVVIAGKSFRLDPAEMQSATLRAREYLLERGDIRFPVITYISAHELATSPDEAA